jgi:hypothetical protein
MKILGRWALRKLKKVEMLFSNNARSPFYTAQKAHKVGETEKYFAPLP